MEEVRIEGIRSWDIRHIWVSSDSSRKDEFVNRDLLRLHHLFAIIGLRRGESEDPLSIRGLLNLVNFGTEADSTPNVKCFGKVRHILMNNRSRNVLARLDSKLFRGHWEVRTLIGA